MSTAAADSLFWQKAESGSNEIDDYLIMLLDNTVPDPQSHACQIKETLCWVSLNIDGIRIYPRDIRLL